MAEEFIQVGRFLLKKRKGYESFEARQRLMAARMSCPKHPMLPKGCKNPDKAWSKCRAIKPNGERCGVGRHMFNFCCGTHDPMKRIGNVYVKTWGPIQTILDRIGFRGEIRKFSAGYCFQFYLKPPKSDEDLFNIMLSGCWFRFETEIKKINEIEVRQWVELAMKAEEFAYSPMNCIRCLKPFRIVDGIGNMSDVGDPVCDKCRKAYYKSDRYIGQKKIVGDLKQFKDLFRGLS